VDFQQTSFSTIRTEWFCKKNVSFSFYSLR